MPLSIQSGNGGDFTAKVTQEMSGVLGIQWKLYALWRPQSTGKTENMNHTLKETIAKICQETNLTWDKVLPVATLRVRVASRSRLQLSPYEILYWRPFLKTKYSCSLENGHIVKELDALKCVQSLGATLCAIHKYASSQLLFPADIPLHYISPGDWILLKTWKNQHPEDQLQPKWHGPYEILLVTHSSVKLKGVKPWIHHS